jgi:DNA primase
LTTLPDRYGNLPLGMKDKAIKRLTTLAAKIDDAVRRELFLQEVSERYNISTDALKQSVKPSRPKSSPAKQVQKSPPWEEDFLALLLSHPVLVGTAVEKVTLADFSDNSLADIYGAVVKLYQESGHSNASHLIDQLQSTAQKERAAQLAATDFGRTPPDELFKDCLQALRRRSAKRRLDELRAALAKAEREGDKAGAEFYAREIQQLRSPEP